MWAFPCPWMPAMPTRMTSLAPRTRPEDLVPAMVKSGKAALAATVCLRKLRRVMLMNNLDNIHAGSIHLRCQGEDTQAPLSETLSEERRRVRVGHPHTISVVR